MNFILFTVSTLWLIVGTNAFWDGKLFHHDRNHRLSGKKKDEIQALEAGKEEAFSLSRQEWKEYVLRGGGFEQECVCVADCANGDLDLFLHSTSEYELDLGFQWDCDATQDAGTTKNCRIQPPRRFNCYAILYGATVASDCGITCNFLTPP